MASSSNPPRRSVADRAFRALLLLLPRDFRAAHGDEMTQVFRTERRLARSERGPSGVVTTWIGSLSAILLLAPREHAAILRQDLTSAWRAARRTPVISAAVVLTMGVGIGAAATLFSFLNALMFRPLPVPDAAALVSLANVDEHLDLPHGLSLPQIADLAAPDGPFSGVVGYVPVPASMTADGRANRALLEIVTPDYFTVLGVPPGMGRVLSPATDASPGAADVLVLSHHYWQRRFGGDPSVVGRALRVDGHPFTVVGVAPEWFHGTEALGEPDGYVSSAMLADLVPNALPLDNRSYHVFRSLGRLRHGVSLAEARAGVALMTSRLADAHPASDHGVSVMAVPETHSRPEPSTGAIMRTAGAVFATLVTVLVGIVCANVTNLLLVRAAGRRREVALRTALGARRSRLVRQFLTESVLFSLAGGAVGILAAVWATAYTTARLGDSFPGVSPDFAPDARVVAFTFVLAVAVGALSGLAPALDGVRHRVGDVLKSSTAAGGGRGRSHKFRNTLVVTQVALALALLVSAGLFARSLAHARIMDLGFDASHVLVLSVDPALQGYDAPRRAQYYEQAVTRVRALPGVRAASWTSFVPFSGNLSVTKLHIEGRPVASESETPTVLWSHVGAEYFQTVGTAIVRGRGFTAADNGTSPPVAVVNETLAHRYWPGEDPIGRRISVNGADGPFLEVVGVARDGKYVFLWEDRRPFLYTSARQQDLTSAALLVRVDGDPAAAAPAVTAALARIDPDMPLYGVKTLARHLATGNAFLPFRAAAFAAGLFGIVGLLLAVIGIYAVMSFSVTERLHEIGVRMALGADHAGILGLIVRRGLALATAGVVVGAVVAVALARLVGGLLLGVRALDPLVWGATTAVIVGVSLLACYVPASRAATVDPLQVLRAE